MAPMKWLLPREHGAYGQLGVPLAASVAIGDLRLPVLALAGAAVAAFLAHEPMLLLLGQRGQNARERNRRDARFWLVLWGVAAAALFGAGVFLLEGSARWLVGVPAVAAAPVGLAVLLRREKTAWGEVLAAIALSSWALPLSAGGGASPAVGLTCWIVFALCFASATASVRGLIARSKGEDGRGGLKLGAALPAASAAIAALLAWKGWTPAALPLTFLPLVLFGVALWWRPPRARQLRRLGWGLVVASVLTGALLVLVLR